MELKINVLNENGYFDGKVSRGRQCAYCDKAAKLYVWCEKHLAAMISLKVNMNKEVNQDE